MRASNLEDGGGLKNNRWDNSLGPGHMIYYLHIFRVCGGCVCVGGCQHVFIQ